MPFPKVYWKGLRLVLGRVLRYINKWQSQLDANLTDPQMAAVIAVRDAAEDCLNLLPTDTPAE